MKLITAFLFSLISWTAYGQQIGQYTQYFSNELIINPAFAGAHEALSLTLVHRSQWSGLEGAPSTQTFSGHSLFKNQHIGLGASIINDKVGIHQNLTFNTSYAYHLKIKKDGYLSMGLQVGVNHKQSDFGEVAGQIQNAADPSISSFKETSTAMEVGTGIYYRDSKLHIGLSSPKMFTSKSGSSDSMSIDLDKPHYFLYSRYRVPVNHNIKIQPGLLVKYLPGVPLSFDIHLAAIFNEVLLTGLSYRSFESIGLVLQAKLTPQLKAGYNFDYPVGKTGELSHSSHEFMLNYLFKYSRYKVKRPR
jgi:type IX secretion system PorP/SprF family membrane protein